MEFVQRFDSVLLDKAVTHDSGWVTAPGRLARAGIQLYVRPDGTVVRELRPPEEVFHPDSLKSLGLLPVVNGHPSEAGANGVPGYVDASNTKRLQVGTVGEHIVQDGDFVAANVRMTDQDAIRAVQAGKVQLSLGYTCRREMTPGIWNGQPYDLVQREIRGNHVALVHVGRAGPDVRLRLDSADNVDLLLNGSQSDTDDLSQGARHMEPKTLKLDGLDFAGVPATAVQAVEKAISARDIALASAGKTTSEAIAAQKLAEAKVQELQLKLDEACNPETLRKAVAARTALEALAKEADPKAFKQDAADADLRKLVIKARIPGLTLDGADEIQLNAFFEAAKATKAAAPAPKTAPMPKREEVVQDEAPKGTLEKSAYQKQLERNANAWKAGK